MEGMRYLIAILCPPLAILLCGKLFTAIASGVLWLFCLPLVFAAGLGLVGWLVLMAHAWIVISNHKATISRVRTGRLFAAIAVACFASSAVAADMTLEKAQYFQSLWDREQKQMEASATADLMEFKRQRIIGIGVAKQHMSKAQSYLNRIKKREPLTYPTLTSKSVGSIGAIGCPHEHGYPIVEESDHLTLTTRFEALGNSYDNGATFIGRTINGYGDFVLSGFDKKRIGGNRYRKV